MFRDRTNLYLSYRQSFAHHPSKKKQYLSSSYHESPFSRSSVSEERSGLIASNGNVPSYPYEDEAGESVIEMDLLPPVWADVQDEILALLADITHQCATLERLHQKNVLPGFGNEDVRAQERKDIDRLTQSITMEFQECQTAIAKIGRLVAEAKASPKGLSKENQVMAKNLQISLAARVQETSANFRRRQSNYLKKLRGLENIAPQSPTIQAQNPYSDPSLIESDADKSYSQATLQQSSQLQGQNRANLNFQESMIARRENEINEIAHGIIQLSDIFRNLQTMVIDQGTMLDRIDYNIENMASEVKAADKDITTATRYQRRTTKRKIMLLLIIIIVGLIIILIIKPKKHPSSQSTRGLANRERRRQYQVLFPAYLPIADNTINPSWGYAAMTTTQPAARLHV